MPEFIIVATTVVEARTAAEAEAAIADLYAGQHDVDIESEFAEEENLAAEASEDLAANLSDQYRRHVHRCQADVHDHPDYDGCGWDGDTPRPAEFCATGQTLTHELAAALAAKAEVAGVTQWRCPSCEFKTVESCPWCEPHCEHDSIEGRGESESGVGGWHERPCAVDGGRTGKL